MKKETRKGYFAIGYDMVTFVIEGKENTSQPDRGTIVLDAGTRDYLSMHRYDKEHTLVLCMNRGLGYIGYELINRKTMDRIHDGFFQNAEEEIRPDIFDLSDCTIADIVSQWIM